ncbi:hypothetical protein OCU04_011599 [Sclerotinia nivalis]|uniref:Cytochrome P450 n=1 Tax=Sclerotinia nivalis TaxID=352851 RepID=A0A9X0DFQ9_9HELO|nr:hypothetical protein OCU04_011599 [Sclerotinia nivalis]
MAAAPQNDDSDLTEKNNELVWQQSLTQANGMLQYWTQNKQQPVRSTHHDTKVFTLNVLAAALFNKVYPFEGQDAEKLHNHEGDKSYQYRESLSTILSSIIQIFVFGEQGLKAWWTPESFKNAAKAMNEFRSYIFGLMDEETAHNARGEDANNHLVARLVRACEEDQAEEDMGSDAGEKGSVTRKMTLTKEEILSNLFVYTFAGNDTTAIALTNLLTHLAANPDSQDWISEEINYYLPSDDMQSWNYEIFFKLRRCGAVVVSNTLHIPHASLNTKLINNQMETLRVCHPLSQLVKTTGSTAQPLEINGKTYIIPAGVSVHCSLPALHTHPRYWGDNPLAWNPCRFISKIHSSHDNAESNSKNTFESEVLAPETSENFMPFAWGQRVCPGKKFAQVELVAVLARLFRDWKVEPEPRQGETLEQARDRVWRSSLVVDHERHMLHEMYDPESVGLRWVRR